MVRIYVHLQRMLNTSSEDQTVDLSNKCMTKDYLRYTRHGSTVWRTTEQYLRNKCTYIREGSNL
jgi:hypothetical protein